MDAVRKGVFSIISKSVLIFLLAGIVFVGVIVFLEDRNSRNELLLQAKLVEKAIGSRRVLNFSGSQADLESPNYNHLKEQLISIRSVNPECRFIYLLGKHPDGRIFFFVDSEPAGSGDYSPPGQIYDEASVYFHKIFLSGKNIVIGPQADRWGVWVSALIPVIDQPGGKVIAVLGMDIDARTWIKAILYRTLFPFTFFLLIYGLIVFLFYVQRRNNQENSRLAESRIALQDSENKYHSIFLNFPDAIAIFRPAAWKFYSGNPAMLKMFGLSDEKQLLSLRLDELSPERQADGDFSVEKIKKLLEIAVRQDSLFLEWVHRRLNGEEFPSTVLLAKIELAGEVMVQMMIRDITQHKKIEEENIKHMKELEVFYKVSMGREERIIELKKEVDRLKKEIVK
ncbi:MAG: PAS domain S-box protein [Candidatus Omnitrophica bacterium]|nr:PAS domain S-box protein [Candidatus Omnitrophota bacterium]